MARWRKICLYLPASVIMHAGLLLILTRTKHASKDAKLTATPSAVNVRIVPAAPKITTPAATAAASTKIIKPRVAHAKRGSAKNVVPHPARGTAEHQKPAVALRYDQLFPKAGIDYPIGEGNDIAAQPTGRSARGAGFDPEDDISFAARVRHLSKLTTFARDLAELVSIPSALRQIQSRGTVRLRFSRQNDKTWSVTEATGDPYFRALLYEALTSLSPNTYSLVMLSASDLESVRVVFEYRTISSVDRTAKPVDVRVDGNKIFIVVTHHEIDPKWQMLAVTPTGMPAVNLIGVGMVLAKPYLEKDPHTDIDIQKLRLSPAFIQPIGR